MTSLVGACRQGRPLVLDGAIGTQLDARGFSTAREGWSAAATWDAPELLASIHREYVASGADVITANTFRMHPRSLRRCPGAPSDAVSQSVAIARTAEPRFLVGSIGPLEDCYMPELTPPDGELAREHALMAERIADAGVDAILLETMPTYREAAHALAAAQQTGLDVLVSLWPQLDHHLGDGELVAEAATRLSGAGAAMILVNCLPAEDVSAVMPLLSDSGAAIGVYANTGQLVDEAWASTAAEEPAYYGRLSAAWSTSGARLVGGCCGTKPAHIRAIRESVGSLTESEQTP